MSDTKVTQARLAQELGLSQALVSRVLNGDTGKVSCDTARRIRDLAASLGYSARTVRPARFLGLLHYHQRSFYEERLVRGVLAEAQEHGCAVIQHLVAGDGNAREYPEEINGWIVPGALPATDAVLRGPLVLLHYPDYSGRYDSVMEDNRAGMRMVIQSLYDMGHRRFGFFLMRPMGVQQAEIHSAFIQALSELDLPVPVAKWIATPHRHEGSLPEAERLVREYLALLQAARERPSVIITGDVFALPMLRLAGEYGLRIPKDLSIVGYDDTPECLAARPMLSSLAQPLELMGRMAVRRLLYRSAHPDEPPLNLRVPMEFMQRDSVAACT